MSGNTFNRATLSREGARLLEALLEHMDEAGRAQVSTSELLGASGLTQGAFIRGRSELAGHGLLRSEPGFSSNGLRGANVYTLNMAALIPDGESGEQGENETDGLRAGSLPAGMGDSTASGRSDAPRKGGWSWLPWRSRSS